MTNLFRWILKHCMDCGKKLSIDNKRGDVCDECFENFDGMLEEDLINSVLNDLNRREVTNDDTTRDN